MTLARLRRVSLAFLLGACAADPSASAPDAAPPPAVDAGPPPAVDAGPPPARDAGSPPDATLEAGADAGADAGLELVRSATACALPGVRRVSVPADYRRPNGRRLELAYRVFSSGRPGAPTVLVAPGGPGAALMARDPAEPFALGALPTAAVDVVATDARGSGCNAYPPFGAEADSVYTLEHTARDLLAVAADLGRDSLVLYGASFGTAQVTVATSLAEREGGPRPRLLVLEGTLGRAFDSFDAYFSAFTAEWRRVEPLLPAVWRAEFAQEPFSPRLFWSREQWGAFIAQQLILGDYPGHGPLLAYFLDGLSRRDPAAERYVATFMAGVGAGRPSELFATLACRELWGSWRPGRELRAGALVATGDELCPGPKTRPYDSAEHPLSTPIVYFQGPHDPTTTPDQLAHHVETHRTAPREVVTVPAASHAPLTLGLAARGCAGAVWDALLHAPGGLAEVLAACPGDPIDLEIHPAE